MKSEGSVETPQDIMDEYNGCSVPQYTRYPLYVYELEGSPRIWADSSREDKYSLVKLAVPCVRGVLLSF